MTVDKPEPVRLASDAGDVAQEELASQTRQFVTFVAGGEIFAVDMAPVQEIIRVPAVVRVPMAPRALEGLANLRGRVLPIISLRRIFGFEERADDDASRAVVIDLGQPLGFVVDRVASVVGVEPHQIEDVGAISATVRSDLVCGLLKGVAGHAMVMVLDVRKLVAREFADLALVARGRTGGAPAGGRADETEDEAPSDELQLVSFEVAGQEYAIAIEDVQEIVQVPDAIAHVPRAQSHVLGVMTLRNRLLPLVSLRCMFDLPGQDADARSRIVVVSVGGASVGVVTDSVKEVLRVARCDVDPMPGLLARDRSLLDITEICRLEGGKRLVSILSVAHMFRHASVQQALTTLDTMQQPIAQPDGGEQDEHAQDDEEQVVVFRLSREEFGVPIHSVQEIVRVPENLTHVPKAPPAVEGVINLRGAVLPVMDLRRRLGLVAVERSDSQRIMVFVVQGLRTGFIVDSVAEVLKIPKSAIAPVPRLCSERKGLLARMANLERAQRMVQLIDPMHLVEEQDVDQMAALSAA